jgi:high-affinity nickel-transport protein
MSTVPFGIALLGLLMGMRHATDPDHIIAVTTIVSREHRLVMASRIGIAWGFGHTLTVLAVGALIIFFKIAIPVRLGLAMEFAVAIVLILLGVGAAAGLIQRIVRRLMRTSSPSPANRPLTVHSHVHNHGAQAHRHPHVHAGRHLEMHEDVDHGLALKMPSPRFSLRRPLLRAFGVGLVHGLAGSAAIALLVLTAIPQPLWATIYLAIFCIGTIIGMGIITTAIATPFMLAAERMLWINQGLVTSSGLLSFAFGLFLAYRLGIVDRLFGATPIWAPH